jgi:hydroxyacylglutathione hydrolase
LHKSLVMEIKQWEDKYLSHFSYAILNENEKKIILIDPARNPKPYLDFAEKNGAVITGVIETHPHADFVSSHLEIHQKTGAVIYASKLVNAYYPHQTFDEGEEINLGNIKLKALHTPGHSPDSICIVLHHEGKDKAVFTGDTLFIGDCGRPDLREGAGNIKATRNDLAKQMYHSLRDKLMTLADHVIVYPAHGAGTLCGKALSKAESSTIGAEKMTNWSLQKMSEEEFVKQLLSDQPFVPAYFPYSVELNRKGAPHFEESVNKVNIETSFDSNSITTNAIIVDTRDEKIYKKGHLPNSINIMEGTKFETWLGSIIKPEEKFYLAGQDKNQLKKLIDRSASIGYEGHIEKAFIVREGGEKIEPIKVSEFKDHKEDYTIVDVRNPSEVKEKKIFENSIAIPLAELRERVHEIPTGKPVVVHCAAGYRSAAGTSIIQSKLNGNVKVFDLSDAIKDFN